MNAVGSGETEATEGGESKRIRHQQHLCKLSITVVKEKTVTCEEISGTGPRGEEIKQGKKERKKTDKERVKLPEGRRKEGYCACALTGCVMKLLFCVVCSD